MRNILILIFCIVIASKCYGQNNISTDQQKNKMLEIAWKEYPFDSLRRQSLFFLQLKEDLVNSEFWFAI